MQTILRISQREITRLRTRFTGRARPLLFVVLAGTFFLAYLAFRQGSVRGRSLYRVGVAPDVPAVQDPRFDSVTVSPDESAAMLQAQTLDVYIDAGQVQHDGDEKSLYAAGALQLYLETQELARIEREYAAESAFPLRVEAAAFPAEQATQKEIIIPSLTGPPLPFEQVVSASLYLLPISLISVFFTSGFMDEKMDRRISVLLSTPVTPLQIILGKMLPYMIFALFSILVLALVLRVNPLLALAIFIPVVFFSFAVYLIVPLMYRTFKDTTFISMFATTAITMYLLFPAMFVGISDLSAISPISMAVKLQRGQSFGLKEYLTSTAAMYLVFGMAVYVGCRVLNEEYLMKYRPLHRKVADAIYLTLHREHPYLSVFLLSLALIPIVYMLQLGVVTVAVNFPMRYAIGILLVISIIIEEITKSAGIAVLIENGDVTRTPALIALAFLSAVGFLLGEKLLLLISISSVSESVLAAVLFNAGKLWIPLLAHFTFTTIVTLLTRRLGARWYIVALLGGVAIHVVYNLYVLGIIP
ncbi:MAG: ABC transporter permease [Anaerolineae bacterium]|nr:ABC transporter permease [Anaerolineae bacterium]